MYLFISKAGLFIQYILVLSRSILENIFTTTALCNVNLKLNGLRQQVHILSVSEGWLGVG